MVEIAEIVIITYCLCNLLKIKVADTAIPAIAGLIGMGLGIICYKFMPDFPANNIITAVAIGASSGLASTGANQIIKQKKKKRSDVNEEEASVD